MTAQLAEPPWYGPVCPVVRQFIKDDPVLTNCTDQDPKKQPQLGHLQAFELVECHTIDHQSQRGNGMAGTFIEFTDEDIEQFPETPLIGERLDWLDACLWRHDYAWWTDKPLRGLAFPQLFRRDQFENPTDCYWLRDYVTSVRRRFYDDGTLTWEDRAIVNGLYTKMLN